ncbi:hypothetical protein M3175_20875 [Robertmurraya korlensis]|uniref:hypothetical protein n=1 Tax=Robertmurraya korlensis TaxID=519977 RepID=UPI00203CDA93|nr:hypothetical protein [Robertmurraya korlensis]MCM3603196.1 hypothetical protein [Robertmurraya korlensis]
MIFINNLEAKLTSLGVSSEHIQFLKQELLEPNVYDNYYDLTNDDESIELVPTKNIASLGLRGVSNQTWWDHAIYKVGTLEKYRMDRFERKNNFSDLGTIYQIFSNDEFADRKEAVELKYYPKDNKYFVINGNHRVTWAKLLNVPAIKAKVLRHSLNQSKFSNYFLYVEAKELLIQVIKSINMRYVYENNYIDVYFKDIFVVGRSCPQINDFSNEEVVNMVVETFRQIIDYLRKIERDIKFYQIFSEKLRKPIMSIVRLNTKKESHLNLIKRLMEE